MRPKFRVCALNKINERWDSTGNFLVEIHAEVVESMDGRGGEAFRVWVVSPFALVEELKGSSEIESGRGYLFMNDYDEREVMRWLQRRIDTCNPQGWEELTACIGKYFDWI